MKFAAVVLLACVAVSSAAFTANLVQDTQPAMAKAVLSMRLAAGNKAFALPAQVTNTISAIIDNVVAQANQLLATANEYVAQGQAVSQSLLLHLQTLANSLQGAASQTAQLVSQNIKDFIASVQQSLGGNRALNYDQAIAIIKKKIQDAFAVAQNLINQINLPNLINNAINTVLESPVGQLVVAHMNNKAGFLDFFGDIFEQAIGHVTGAWENFTGTLGSVVSQIVAQGTSGVAQAQQIAQTWLNNVHEGVSGMTSSAAQNILALISQHNAQFSGALGDTLADVITALQNIEAENNDNSQRRF